MLLKTDSEIEQWVLKELRSSEGSRSAEVCVMSRDGLVRLRGSAPTYQDKLAIEEATRRANGVVGVVNEIRLKRSIAISQRPIVMRRPGLVTN